MHIYKLLKIGANHNTHCEDFLLETDSHKGYRLFGVFDGCSSGTDSFLASALTAKIIRNEFNCLNFKNEEGKSEILIRLLWESLLKLRQSIELYGLQTVELLTTIGLLLFDEENGSFQIVFIGDGIVSLNGKPEIIEQNNAPNYLAYHLHKIGSIEQMSEWLGRHARHFSGKHFNDLSISTDGLLSFSEGNPELNTPIPIDFMLTDTFLTGNMAMLARKANIMQKKYAMVNADDLGIIRLHNI